MKKIAVILSGCGVFDGSEIYETTLSLLALDKLGALACCAAPAINQYHVVNHFTNQPQNSSKRNVLEESARLARGQVQAISDLELEELSGAIFPGGFGAAKNLSTFAYENEAYQVEPSVKEFIEKMHASGKPLGFLCIAPVIAAKLFGEQGIQLTIGKDPQIAGVLEKLGAKHIECPIDQIVVDSKLKIVTTPAYMLAKSIKDLEPGITELVQKILELS